LLVENSVAKDDSETSSVDQGYVVGKHVYGNLYGVRREILADKDLLEKTMLDAAMASGARIIDMKSWVVQGPKGGVSVIVLVQESHLALHTWVEYGYATVDIYTCGEHTDPRKGLRVVFEVLKPKKHAVHYVIRDSRREEIVASEV